MLSLYIVCALPTPLYISIYIYIYSVFIDVICHYVVLSVAVRVKAHVNTVSDKVKNRLDQLDDFEEVCTMYTFLKTYSFTLYLCKVNVFFSFSQLVL